MEDDIKQIYEYYFTFDKPIPYISISSHEKIKELESKINELNKIINQPHSEKEVTNEEYETISENIKLISEYKQQIDNLILLIHPVLMSDYFSFYNYIRCLLIEKNKVSDPKIISMSYLDYLFYLIENSREENFAEMFLGIVDLCLKADVKDIQYATDKKGKVSLIIHGIEVNKKDFDNIKKIICYQNMPSYDDTYIDPELEKALKEAEELKGKDNAGTTTLERQMICVSKGYPYKLNELYEVTIRKFVQMLQVADAQLHYQIYKTGECGGMVTYKEPILHYMYTKDTRFDSMSDYTSFTKKMEQVT